MIQAVDLASRYSAFCVIDAEGGVVCQVHSWKGPGSLTPDGVFVEEILRPWKSGEVPAVLGVEEIPHSLMATSKTMVKRVARLQGRICEAMDRWGYLDRVLFVPPDVWQRDMGVWRQGPEAVVPRAREDFGYEPPDTGWEKLHKKDREVAKKARTDFSAAYLIARWLQRKQGELGSFDIPGTLRYQ